VTIFPVSLTNVWSHGETIAAAALGQNLALSNPVRNTIALYLHLAGIESGYGFFAPNVPNNYKVVFELQYPDDHIEYDLPRVRNAATGLRLETLLERIHETTYPPLRKMMLKMLAYSVWQEHPNAVGIRVVFGYVNWPTPAEMKQGKTESFEFLYAYDFTFGPPAAKSRDR
jgi:hypothetical protein